MSIHGVGSGGGGVSSMMMNVDGDPAEEVAELQLATATQERKIAHTSREAAEAAEDAEEQAQVATLHQKADDLRSAATSEMVSGIIGGAASIGAGAVQIAGGVEQGNVDAAKAAGEAPSTAARTWAEIGGGAGKAIEGSGKVTSALIDGTVTAAAKERAGQADAVAAQHENAAAHAKRAADDARDDARDANEAANKALDWFKDYSSTRSQAASAALHRA